MLIRFILHNSSSFRLFYFVGLILPLPPNDKICNHLIANPLSHTKWHQDKKSTEYPFLLLLHSSSSFRLSYPSILLLPSNDKICNHLIANPLSHTKWHQDKKSTEYPFVLLLHNSSSFRLSYSVELILPLPPNDKIRNHLVTNPISHTKWHQDKKSTECLFALLLYNSSSFRLFYSVGLILPLPPNDKIRNHLVANPISHTKWHQDKKSTECSFALFYSLFYSIGLVTNDKICNHLVANPISSQRTLKRWNTV